MDDSSEQHRAIDAIKSSFPAMFELLTDFSFDEVFSRTRIDNETHYWQSVELIFFLRSLRLHATDRAWRSVCESSTPIGREVGQVLFTYVIILGETYYSCTGCPPRSASC